MQRPQLLIFTDLDGTLLDHHSYSWQAARPALQQLQQRRIPLILTTSKTAAETAQLHRELQLDSAYIIENGAGIVLPQTDKRPHETVHFFGKTYTELIDIMQQLRSAKGYRFVGFNDFSRAQLCAATGLSTQGAELAKQRQCSEPIRWDGTDAELAAFRDELHSHDLQLLRGGRFYHVLGTHADKGRAVNWLLDDYQKNQPGDYFSVGLGDGPNDQQLLEVVDLAVIIPSCSGLAPQPQRVKTLLADSPGPQGWNNAILHILNTIDSKGAFHG